jgi:hypothetical protein
MNFHLFVFIATIIFYIIFKVYKTQIQNTKNKNKSFLIYVLFIPALLYLTDFIFNITNTKTNVQLGGSNQIFHTNINKEDIVPVIDINMDNIDFDSLLTSPYPESSVIS